jgi:hypothetical protein
MRTLEEFCAFCGSLPQQCCARPQHVLGVPPSDVCWQQWLLQALQQESQCWSECMQQASFIWLLGDVCRSTLLKWMLFFVLLTQPTNGWLNRCDSACYSDGGKL